MDGLDILSILVIAFGLSADCFAVALGSSIAMKNVSLPRGLRVSLSFGVFQALMLVSGWLAGRTVVEFIEDYDHWLAFALLAIIGGRMLWESFRSEEERPAGTDITRGIALLTLSIATSIDSLAVGLSFAFLEVNIALASAVIGSIAFLVTAAGFLIGRKASQLLGKRAETIGGIILIAIGLRILLEHLF